MRLMLEDARADNASVTSVWTPLRRRARRDERGQALVEFALIAPLFLMLVVGVVQFAVALNFWFDLQRLSNQGARSAAVNCGPAAAPQCGTQAWTAPGTGIEAYLRAAVISRGNTPDEVEVCYVPPSDPAPGGWSPAAGDAVRVRLEERYRLQAVVRLAKIDLAARATMRLEQEPTSGGPLPTKVSSNYVLATNAGSGRCEP
jgi:Flp pilus assembly pilin Flp